MVDVQLLDRDFFAAIGAAAPFAVNPYLQGLGRFSFVLPVPSYGHRDPGILFLRHGFSLVPLRPFPRFPILVNEDDPALKALHHGDHLGHFRPVNEDPADILPSIDHFALLERSVKERTRQRDALGFFHLSTLTVCGWPDYTLSRPWAEGRSRPPQRRGPSGAASARRRR